MTEINGSIGALGDDVPDQINALEDGLKSLQRQFRLQELLIGISDRILNLPLDAIESRIQGFLGEIAEFVEADQVHVFDYDRDKQIVVMSHEWSREGIEPIMANSPTVSLATVDELGLQMRSWDEIVWIPDVSAMPDGSLSKLLDSRGGRSQLIIPSLKLQKRLGVVGFSWLREKHTLSLEEQRLLAVFATMVVDIRRRKQDERSAKEFQQRFHTAFQMNPIMMMIVRSDDARFVEVNREFEEQSGQSRNEVIGRTPLDLNLITAEMGYSELRKTLEFTGFLRNVEFRFRGRLGYIHVGLLSCERVKVDGEPHDLLAVVDITERKQIEEALRESREILNATLNAMPVRVFWKDRNLSYLGCNEQFARDAGFKTPGEVIGKDDFAMGWRDQAERYRADDQAVIEKGEAKLLIEEPQTTPSGKTIYLLTSKVPLRDAAGEIVGILGTYHDITETIRLRQQESRAQRLEAAGQVAGQVAHDLNNLLAPLLAYPDLIRNYLPLGHHAIPLLNAIQESASRMAEINQQLLTLGRRGHSAQDVLNLNTIIQQAIADLGQLPDTLDCETNLDPHLKNIRGIKVQFHRAIINLLVNARDAVNDSGLITISSQNCRLEQILCAYTRIPPGNYVRISVADNGCGIPDHIIQRIFDPFYTTKSADQKRGSGLGLSIVDAVVKDHGGYIDIISKVGHGTTFFLYLPITDDPTAGVPDHGNVGQ